MTASDVQGQLALAVLSSEERIAAAIKLAQTETLADPLTALAGKRGARWRGLGQCFDQKERLRILNLIAERLLESDRRWAGEDIGTILHSLADDASDGLMGWFEVLIARLGLKIRFETDEPVIDLASLRGWLTCTEFLDADSLLCFTFARSYEPRALERMTEWPIVARIADRDLQRLTRQGVSDLHIHQGSLRNAHALWQGLISGAIDLDNMPMESIADQSRGPELAIERHRLRWVIEHIADPTSMLGRLYEKIELSENDPIDPWRSLKRLRCERRMLVRAFTTLNALLKSEQPDKWRNAIWLEHALDVYIHTKSRFIRLRTQGVTTNPGLNRFRKMFNTMKWTGEFPNLPVNHTVVRTRWHDHLLYLLQGGSLRRVELRFAPLPGTRGSSFLQQLKTWDALERDFDLANHTQAADIRFAVHFKRSLDLKNRAATPQAVQELRRRVADEAAALHEFRCAVAVTQDRRFVSRIARIDFAGQERDVPPDVAAFAINLARGDEDALAALKYDDVDPVTYGRWLQLMGDSSRADQVALPPLGLTCHAGEDFAHPLEGVYAMVRAADGLKMREGDTIGHGLAAGVDVERFHRERLSHVVTEAGQQFDALLWLYTQMMLEGSSQFGTQLVQLEEWLWSTFAELYPGALPPPSLMMLEDIGNYRAGPVWRKGGERWRENTKSPAARLADREVHDEKTFTARAERLAPAELYDSLVPAVRWAQGKVVDLLSSRGILFEFNPSSNWRISGATQPKEIPIIPLLTRHKGKILATINTDNPGVFGTRIENEYAIVLVGLCDAGIGREEALGILESIRRNGLERVYWPPSVW